MSERTDAVILAYKTINSFLCTGLSDDLAGQGAVLAQALAEWLVRHPKQERAVVLDLHLVGVRDMVARREREEG